MRGRSWTQQHITVLSNQVPRNYLIYFAPNYMFREQVSFGSYFSRILLLVVLADMKKKKKNYGSVNIGV